MCGFCGFIGEQQGKEVILKKMMDKIIYRGPDSSGMYADTDIGLGFRRLSIIDLSDGAQPIYNEDKTKVILFNGEIYNYKEIKEDLLNKGHQFYTKTDTEVLLHGYEEYKEKILDKLRGMFTFAIWDIIEKELFIARDFFGIKPMYYTQNGKELIFGSEIKSILEHPSVTKELNINALQNYLSFQYGVPNETFFKGIKCLPPAHYLKYKDGQVTITRYWEPQFNIDESLDRNNNIKFTLSSGEIIAITKLDSINIVTQNANISMRGTVIIANNNGTTTIKVLSKLFLLITSKIGNPALPEGSLSSFFLSIFPNL